MVLLAACNYTGLDTYQSNADVLSKAVANTRAAKSYDLVLRTTGKDGETIQYSVEADAANNRAIYDVQRVDASTRYVSIGADTFVSDDGGTTFRNAESMEESITLDVLNVNFQFDELAPVFAAKAGGAIRKGNPDLENIDGILTGHFVTTYNDLPTLVPTGFVADISPEVGTIDVWVTLGPQPTIRRMTVGFDGASRDASVVADWSKLDEPVAIEAPEITEVNNADLLMQAADNMEFADSYAMSANMTQGNININLDGKVDVYNDSSIFDIDTAGMKIKLITVEGDAYLSTDDGDTYIQTGLADTFLAGLSQFTDIWSNFTLPGTDWGENTLRNGSPAVEVIDGVQTRHIVLTADPLLSLTASGGSNTQSATMDLWISTDDDPYVYQMKVKGVANKQKIDATIKWSRFNEDFLIEAPPVDDANTYVDPAPAQGEPPRIALTDFKALYDDKAKRPLIIDVRPGSLFAMGHIAGAISFPESEVDARVGELPKDTLIVAYCQ